MRLNTGDTITPFDTTDLEGNPFGTDNLLGKKTLLTFFRYVSCPFCNLRVHELITRYNDKPTDFQIIGVFESPASSIKKKMEQHELDFTILPDPDRNIYKQFDVKSSLGGFIRGAFDLKGFASSLSKGFYPGKIEGEILMMPADFLINDDLSIHTAYYGKAMSDHIDVNAVDAWIK